MIPTQGLTTFGLYLAGGRPANRQPTDHHRGLPDANRHPLARFAAIAHARIKRHVIAKRADLLKRGGPVADQRGTFHRRADLAVFHAVGLGAREHELAVGDIHLTAAKAHGINAIFQIGQNIGGVSLAAQHIRVGHAWHGRVRVAFSPAVAGRLDAHQAGVLAVLHIVDKDSVLDQYILSAWRAFIVYR